MSAAINSQGFPSPFMFVRMGAVTLQLGDEAGRVLTDEAGRILTPDKAPSGFNLGDEQSRTLTDEDGNPITPNLP